MADTAAATTDAPIPDPAPAPAPPPPTLLSPVVEAFNRLTSRQKLVGMVGIALVVALVVIGLLWTREPPYAVLFSNFDEKDGGQIIAALTQQNVPYKYAEGGRAILVPPEMVHDLRLRMASQGLPKGGLVGFELMESQRLGISSFAEQINYQRGLEGELARSIQSLAAVKTARVHLAIPKQTAFLRDDQKTSASVVVSLYPGRILEATQVAGVVHLVSSSVPHLNPLNVSVIDQDGVLISQQRDPLREAGMNPAQLRWVREIEADYTKRLETILAPVVGASNVRAQVVVDVDFSQIEQTAEIYKPNPNPDTAVRSQQTTESGTNIPGPMGIPGALTNQPPVPATAPITTPPVPGAGGPPTALPMNYNKNAVINYEVDKTIRHTKGVPGGIRRVSAAVVVNHKAADPTKPKSVAAAFSDVELKQINDLAREAIGFSQDRGDTLSVANVPFTPEEKVQEPFWTKPEVLMLGNEILKYLLIAIAVFWVWRRILKPLVDKAIEPPPPPVVEKTEEEKRKEAEEAAAAEAAEKAREEEEAAAEEDQDSVEIGEDGLPHLVHHNPHQAYEDKLAAARELARKDPKAAANLIKEWVDGGEQGK